MKTSTECRHTKLPSAQSVLTLHSGFIPEVAAARQTLDEAAEIKPAAPSPAAPTLSAADGELRSC